MDKNAKLENDRDDKTPDCNDAVSLDRDRLIYQQEFENFLPSKIFDAHAHLFDSSCILTGARLPSKSPYRKFGGCFTIEQYLDWAGKNLPDQELYINSFGSPSTEMDREASAAYSGRISDNRRFFGMALISPHDSIETVERRVTSNRLIGYKPYLNYVDWKSADDVAINDMMTEAQMEYADKTGLIVILHIPRPLRLSDPLNQSQMVALCRRYPGARIVFAHIGRAYYLNNVTGFLEGIAACENAWIDTSMVNHEGVLEYAFRHFPKDRILFGSDAPIAMLRGKSVEINDQYAYLMGEDYEIGTSIYDSKHAIRFTTFYYEQLRGIKLAATRAGLGDADIEGIFYGNAHKLFVEAVKNNGGDRRVHGKPSKRL